MHVFWLLQFSSVQSLNPAWLFVTPWAIACQASLSFTNSQSLLKHMSIESVMQSNHLILASPSSPAFNLAQHQGLFQWVGSSHQVAKDRSFNFSVNPSNEYSELISFRMVWSLCSPRDSRESCPTPQFKSINSLVLSLLYAPALTSIHDYWKNHSFD